MQLMTREYLSNQRGHPLRTCFYSNATNTEGMLHYEHVLYLVDRDLVKYLRIAHNMIRMDFGTCRQFSRISGENFQDVRGTKEESRICERVSRCGRCSRLSQALEPSPDRRSKERLSNSLRAFQQEPPQADRFRRGRPWHGHKGDLVQRGFRLPKCRKRNAG